MYTKEQLKKKLEDNNCPQDINTIVCNLKNWRIDPVYEDDEKTEYYDELAVSRLIQGIKLKEQGKSDEEILSIVNNGIVNSINAPAVKQTQVQPQNDASTDLKKITVDITTQTLALLAESIAQKITNDISTRMKDADIFKPVMETGKLKRDNEVLASHVEKLLEENKKLISRINFLQEENSKYKHMVGSLYFKQQ